MLQAFQARVSAITKVIGLLSKLTARIFHPLVICQRSLWCSQKHAFTFRAGSGSSHPARALKSNSRRLMRRQIPPRRRVARFGNHVDVRQVGLLHFPARFRLVFTVCFVSLLCAHPRGTWSAIFTARRRRFFFFFFFLRFLFLFLFGRSLASRRRHETRYSRNFWHFSRRGTTLSQYSPVLCPFFLPSFLRCFLPSCRLRYKECLVTISVVVEPTFSAALFPLLPSRYVKWNQFAPQASRKLAVITPSWELDRG